MLGVKGLNLPDFQSTLTKPVQTIKEAAEVESLDENIPKMSKARTNLILCSVCFFIFLICGLETVFQSKIYTYGLCGPLGLTPASAGWLYTIYYATYTLGRLCSIPLSTLVSPATIIFGAIFCCVIGSSVLIIFGNYNSLALFVATGIMGFGICFFFGSAITWLTSSTPHLKSRPMSFIFMGSNLASFVASPLASYMFALDPIYVFYLCLVYVFLTLFTFLGMVFAAKGGQPKEQSQFSE